MLIVYRELLHQQRCTWRIPKLSEVLREEKWMCFRRKFLRNLAVVTRMYRIKTEEVHSWAGLEREMASRGDQRVLRWFSRVKRIYQHLMARRVLIRGTMRLDWMNGVKVALGSWGITVTAVQQCEKNIEACKVVVYMSVIEIGNAMFAWPPLAWGAFHLLRGLGPLVQYMMRFRYVN